MGVEDRKIIFVTGGVVSSLGKGIAASSLGALLKARGHKVTILKMDPYINVDAGTMNPYQHGEVYVTKDGAETDLDLGHYERFIDEELIATNNITTGKVYHAVIERERRGDYLGDTVRVIPHITDQIKRNIFEVVRGSEADVSIVEVGGTVGDIESLPFLEAIRQVKNDLNPGNVLYIHVTLIPHLGAADELKTKPTQHSVKELRSIGIQPDIILCRTEHELQPDHIQKIALYSDIKPEAVFSCRTADTLYAVPLMLEKEGLARFVVDRLNLTQTVDLAKWEEIVDRQLAAQESVQIALVGKYLEVPDAYISIAESLEHAAIHHGCKLDIIRVDAEELVESDDIDSLLGNVHGILVPGGFGARGVEGKIRAITYARENQIPYFGICYGMQWAVVEYARNCCGLTDAHSTEVEPRTENPVITHMPDQRNLDQLGGSMRLGAYDCVLEKGSQAAEAYGQEEIVERHRHRYEVNKSYMDKLREHGLILSGINPERNLVEVIELPREQHPWFLACQYHPEFLSRPYRAHPLFRGFMGSALKRAGKMQAVGAS